MAFDFETKSVQNQNLSLKTHKYLSSAQICLRILATVASLSSACITFTNHQSVILFGFKFEARYSYFSIFRYFGFVNVVVSIMSASSLFIADYINRNGARPRRYFYMFLVDLIMMTLAISACASATAVGLIAEKGNAHSGWLPVCGHVSSYCNRFITSIVLSYFSFLHFVTLTIISAYLSREIADPFSFG